MKERIAELDMIKGFFIFFVMISHCLQFTGATYSMGEVSGFLSSLSLVVMIGFYILSGYTYKTGDSSIGQLLIKRLKSLLVPYYKYCLMMAAVYFIVYEIVEHRSLGWFADGLMALFLQIQSLYVFGTGTGVHEMMYGVFASWFIFQMMVSYIVFIPLYHLLEKKNNYWQLGSAVILLGVGALFYHWNIQGLNGAFFPIVCKMFVLPNIPGIAGLMMLGKCMSNRRLLDVQQMTMVKKIICFAVTGMVVILFLLTDDHLYDFPIGKWGAYQELSYFLSPVCGIALIVFMCISSNVLKNIEVIKNITSFGGKNSIEYLLLHIFIMWLIMYIGGFWYPFLSGCEMPVDNVKLCWIHFVITFVLMMVANSGIIILKDRWKRKQKGDK